MANPFSETQLDLGYDYGCTATWRWKSSIVEHGNGNEQRNAEWSAPMGRWSIGDRSFYLEEGDSLYLRDFFEARHGSYEGFRFKDWSDYEAVNTPIGVGNGALTQFQLVKRYTVGAVYYNRVITKPVSGTVGIKLNGTPLVNWSLNYSTGLVTFSSAPTGTLTASFEFDVPVAFVEDSCTLQLQGAIEDTGEEMWKVSSLSVEEIRVTPGAWPNLGTFGTAPALNYDLGIFKDTNHELTEQTIVMGSPGGWRSASSAWSSGKQKLQFDRVFNSEELIKLQNYFWCCHGSHHAFSLVHNGETYTVRFIDDSFSATFLAADSADSLWQTGFRVLVL